MRPRLLTGVALVGVLGLLGLTPNVQATHDGGAKDNGKHEGMPTPPTPDTDNAIAICAVVGSVSIGNSQSQTGSGGLDVTTKQHNHYRFKGTAACDLTLNPAFAGTFSVDAAGGTDGPSVGAVPQFGTHGEDVARGWSHSDCYAGTCLSWWGNKKMSFTDLYDGTNRNPPGSGQCTNCGEISITGAVTASHSTDNWVKFLRANKELVVWGALIVTAGPKAGDVVCAFGVLDLTHTNPVVPGTAKVVAGTLVGDVAIWDAKGNKANCAGVKGEK